MTYEPLVDAIFFKRKGRFKFQLRNRLSYLDNEGAPNFWQYRARAWIFGSWRIGQDRLGNPGSPRLRTQGKFLLHAEIFQARRVDPAARLWNLADSAVLIPTRDVRDFIAFRFLQKLDFQLKGSIEL